jgi:hypothetical protein
MRVITPYGKTRIQPSGRDDAITVRKNSSGSLYTRRIVNLIEGSNSTLTVADDDTNDEIDVTIASASGNIIGGGTPTIAAGTGAGTGPTISITGTDRAGVISLTAGTSPAGTLATIFTVTFSTAFATAPPVVICLPANQSVSAPLINAAVTLTLGTFVPNSITTTQWSLSSNVQTTLVSGTQYLWYYFVPY